MSPPKKNSGAPSGLPNIPSGVSLIYQQLKAMDYVLGRPRDLARFLNILWQFGRLDMSSARSLLGKDQLQAALWSARQLMDKLVVIRLVLDGRYHFKAEHNLDRLVPEVRAFVLRLHGPVGDDVDEVAACLDELEMLYDETGKRIEACFGTTLWRDEGKLGLPTVKASPADDGGGEMVD